MEKEILSAISLGFMIVNCILVFTNLEMLIKRHKANRGIEIAIAILCIPIVVLAIAFGPLWHAFVWGVIGFSNGVRLGSSD